VRGIVASTTQRVQQGGDSLVDFERDLNLFNVVEESDPNTRTESALPSRELDQSLEKPALTND
jgi:hypothetical protein